MEQTCKRKCERNKPKCLKLSMTTKNQLVRFLIGKNFDDSIFKLANFSVFLESMVMFTYMFIRTEKIDLRSP